MIKTGLIALVLLCLAHLGIGQKITFVKTFGGMGFEMDTITLSIRQVQEVMRINPLAHEEFKKARSYNSLSGVFGFTGALLVAVPLVTAVAGGHPEWSLAAVGGVFIVASIPLNRTFQRHAWNALDEYNKQFEARRPKSTLFLTPTGARLVVRF